MACNIQAGLQIFLFALDGMLASLCWLLSEVTNYNDKNEEKFSEEVFNPTKDERFIKTCRHPGKVQKKSV